MSKTITKTSLRGFTLIELLVVIAIIGLLSTAIMGPVQTGLKKGRDTRKISDLTQVQGALLQYAGDNNGQYPVSLTGLDPTYMKTDAKMLSTSAARDRYMYVAYMDRATNIIGYHLGVALENQNASLQGDADCGMKIQGGLPTIVAPLVSSDWGSISNTDPAYLPGNEVCVKLSAGALTNTAFAVVGNPGATAKQTDFGGAGTAEGLTQVCTSALNTCIFDIIAK